MSPLSNVENRRQVLRAGTTALALPSLEVFGSSSSDKPDRPRNFVAIGTYLGWYQKAFYPQETGKNFQFPATLTPLADFRDDITIFSGLDHRSQNGHGAWSNFLCGQSPKSYSLDQMIADSMGDKSRFASLQLTAGAGEADQSGGHSISYTRQGIPLPKTRRPSVLYRQLFTSKEERARTEYYLKSGRSAIDNVLEDARSLQRKLPASDRQKLDEYFDSVRGVERRMTRQLQTVNDPVPDPNYQLPDYDPITPNLQMEAESIFYDLMVLALETESTRVISLFLDGLGQVFSIDGRSLGSGYHGLSHHGNNPAMLRDLIAIETSHIHCFSRFIKQLKEKKNAQGVSLLDDTIVLLGTGMGDASRHSNRDLPTLLAGGKFHHQGHVATDQSNANAPLLGDLYVTLMQKLGMEVEKFSNASRNMNETLS